jgi:probable HAF family extracellular repeat protein
MRDLGSSGVAIANGINDAGQVVGWSDTAGVNTQHAFITSPDGMNMRALKTLGSTDPSYFSEATGINAKGQVAGWYDTSVGDLPHAFITGPNGMDMKDLGTLEEGYESQALGINATGQVVGWSGTGDNFSPPHPFITGPDGMDMRDLGSLGGDNGSARSINDAGQVVGWSDTAGGASHAFITGSDGASMMDLNSLVRVPGGVILTDAYGINNSGQVIAIGIIPEPEIYALFLSGLALVGFIAGRKKMGGGNF